MTDFRGRFSILSFPSKKYFQKYVFEKKRKNRNEKKRGPENAKSGHFPFFQNLEIFEIFETKKYREKYRDKVKI